MTKNTPKGAFQSRRVNYSYLSRLSNLTSIYYYFSGIIPLIYFDPAALSSRRRGLFTKSDLDAFPKL